VLTPGPDPVVVVAGGAGAGGLLDRLHAVGDPLRLLGKGQLVLPLPALTVCPGLVSAPHDLRGDLGVAPYGACDHERGHDVVLVHRVQDARHALARPVPCRQDHWPKRAAPWCAIRRLQATCGHDRADVGESYPACITRGVPAMLPPAFLRLWHESRRPPRGCRRRAARRGSALPLARFPSRHGGGVTRVSRSLRRRC
jgi:hypothetical protein